MSFEVSKIDGHGVDDGEGGLLRETGWMEEKKNGEDYVSTSQNLSTKTVPHQAQGEFVHR
jgi:hypothetical protein